MIIAFLTAFLGLGSPELPPPTEVTCHKTCGLSEDGVDFIRHFEGYYPYVYKDSAGLPTIGIGHLIKPGEKFDTPMTAETARKLFLQDAAHAVKSLNKRTSVKLRQTQADAIISLTYNIGDGGLGQSSVLRYTNQRKFEQAAASFILWNKVTISGIKVPVRGLSRRRDAEAVKYRSQ
jgi:lysozyme